MLLSKIEKSASKTKKLKRRRPSKKLVATLESLGDALDDIVVEDEQERNGRTRHRSLKSRPGALKKREKVVKGEMERFGRSLAQLAAVGAAAGDGGMEGMDTGERTNGQEQDAEMRMGVSESSSSTSNRWAALRGFISATMEQNPAFVGKG